MRRILFANVTRLALCKRGKNMLRTLYKSDSGESRLETLIKADMDKGELLTVVYAKGLADADGDFADTDAALDSISASMIQNKGAVDIEHDGKVLDADAVRIVEVFRIQKSDPRFHNWPTYGGEPADVTGGVAARLQIDDPTLREGFRSGEWDGVSMFGPAAVEHVDIKAASQRIAARMGENIMTPEQHAALLASQKEGNASIIEAIKSLAPAAPTAEEQAAEAAAAATAAEAAAAKATAPAFEGDTSNPEDLAAYGKALEAFELSQKIANGDISGADLVAMAKSMAEGGPSDEEVGIQAGDSPEIKALRTRLFKAQRASAAPAEGRAASTNTPTDLTKAFNDDDLSEMGKILSGSGESEEGSFNIV